MSRYSRRDILRSGLHASTLAALGPALPVSAQRRRRRAPTLNVLVIAVDDLRPSLGCYGYRGVRTPHIDSLAAQGLTFTQAYAQQADCNPSRASLLSGVRPDTTRVFDAETHFRLHLPGIRTLPLHFKTHGYATAAFSKVFHKPALDDLSSWSLPAWMPASHPWRSDESRALAEQKWSQVQAASWLSAEAFEYDPARRKPPALDQAKWDEPSWEDRAVADAALPDGETADAVIAALGELRAQRFFLAAGFLKPHLPFVAPSKYFDLYPEGDVEIPKLAEAPVDAPPFALHGSEELRRYSDIPASGPIPEKKARELIRGYRACVSYVDAQIGRILQALTDLRLRDNTVVVLFGDHGYHLGEHALWGKQTNFEAATRVPLIVSAPGQPGRGKKAAGLTELVDLYPSLCEICDLPRPPGLEGSSFMPIFEDPERLWKRAVFSQYPREIPGAGPGMGRSMRTRRYRYTEWRGESTPYLATELYDYETDPGETTNIAGRPQHISLVNGLAGMLHDGWRSSLPPTEGPV